MIENIIQAIAKKLKILFPKSKIYEEDIKQGYEEPCFFIIYENDDEKRLSGNRHELELHFRIIYFQDFFKSNSELYEARKKLELEFQNVEYEGFIYRITDRHFKKQDNDLHFTFTIKVQIINKENNKNSFSDMSISEERKKSEK